MAHVHNINETDIDWEYAEDYCSCDFPVETSTIPVICLQCGRYIDPNRLIRNEDGSYSLKINR